MIKAIIGRKLEMTQIFAEDGSVVPVTVVQAGPCTVTQVKTLERDGYSALQLGFGMPQAQACQPTHQRDTWTRSARATSRSCRKFA